MDNLIIDDRTSPDQTIRGPVDRRHIDDRRTNPYSGKVPHPNERRHGPHDRRGEGRRDSHKS